MPTLPKLLPVLVACLLLAACGGDDKPKPPTPPITNVTAAPPPAPTASPPSAAFTPGPTARLENLGGFVWQRGAAGLLAYNRDSVQSIDAAGATRVVLQDAPGETVIGVSETGFAATQAGGVITVRNVRVDTPPVKRFTPKDQFSGAVLSSDGSLVALTLVDRIAVQLWDVEEERMLREYTGFETAAPVYSVRFSPNGRSLIWISRAKVQVMDLAAGTFSPAVSHEDFVGATALTSDNATLVTAAGPKLTLWQVANAQPRTTLPSPTLVTALALSKDDRTLAAGTQQGVRLFDVPLAKEIGSLPAAQPAGARIMAFSEDGRTLAVSDETGLITLWRRP